MVISWFSLAASGSSSPADLRVLAATVSALLRSLSGRSSQAGRFALPAASDAALTSACTVSTTTASLCPSVGTCRRALAVFSASAPSADSSAGRSPP